MTEITVKIHYHLGLQEFNFADVVASWNLSAILVSPSTSLSKILFGLDYENITQKPICYMVKSLRIIA